MMKCWALTFFLMAMLAGLYGFAGVAGGMGWIARWLSVVFFGFTIVMLALELRQHHRHHS